MSQLRRGYADGPIPNVVTDRIVLHHGGITVSHGWTGTWPPPRVLVRVQEKLKVEDNVRIVDPAMQDAGVLRAFEESPRFTVVSFRRTGFTTGKNRQASYRAGTIPPRS